MISGVSCNCNTLSGLEITLVVLVTTFLLLILYLFSKLIIDFLGPKCPFANYCANYKQDSYTCDYSHDEYDHRCYKEKVTKL